MCTYIDDTKWIGTFTGHVGTLPNQQRIICQCTDMLLEGESTRRDSDHPLNDFRTYDIELEGSLKCSGSDKCN